jgi:hypothetical protein
VSLSTYYPTVGGNTDRQGIRYGDEKSASEMLFSYGFLPRDLSETKQVVLNMSLPDDDPLGVAKNMFCRSTPGLKLSTDVSSDETLPAAAASNVTWDSPLVWWACANEEDGLYIGVAQKTDGTKELEATWKGEKIQSPDELQGLLAADPSWEIFQLRAAVLVLERVETQLSLLYQTEESLENLRENQNLVETLFRPEVLGLVSQLRKLERALLQRAIENLMDQVCHSLFDVAGFPLTFRFRKPSCWNRRQSWLISPSNLK